MKFPNNYYLNVKTSITASFSCHISYLMVQNPGIELGMSLVAAILLSHYLWTFAGEGYIHTCLRNWSARNHEIGPLEPVQPKFKEKRPAAGTG